MTTTHDFNEIEILQRKSKIHGFEVQTTSNGLFQLRADPNIWDLYHDKTAWHFTSVEECNSFLEGWSTRALYEQVKKGGVKKSGNDGRRNASTGRGKRSKPLSDKAYAKYRREHGTNSKPT